MGIDRWEWEHRAYRPDRPPRSEVTDDDRLLDVPEDLPIPPPAKPRRRANADASAQPVRPPTLPD